jgi:hypothetical protein
MARDAQQNNAHRALIAFQNYHVKHISWLVTILLGGLLCLSAAGCKKKQAAPKTPEEAMLEVRQVLGTAPKDVQEAYFNTVETDIRYGKTDQALATLDKIASNPGLNEQQKKAVNEFIGLLRAKTAAPTNP